MTAVASERNIAWNYTHGDPMSAYSRTASTVVSGFLSLVVLVGISGCGSPAPAPNPPNSAEPSVSPVPEVASESNPSTDVPVDPPAEDESQATPVAEKQDQVAPKVDEQNQATDEGSYEEALAGTKIPPDWLADVETHYDTNLPWKDARLEIRRLLGLRGEAAKEAIKLTCIYREKGDIGDGHEYPMYLFMGGETAWATKAYIEFTGALLADPDSYTHVHAFIKLASCYSHFGEYQKALETLNTAMGRLPEPPWRIAQEADVHDRLGDVYAKMGDKEKAIHHYSEAARLYPTSNQPYGRHLLKRQATRVQSKMELLELDMLASATLRDGTYTVDGLGYSGDKPMKVTVVIEGGKMSKIDVKHSEKIEQGAAKILPERIVAAQSLRVDGVTGATVTCDAITDAVYRALKKAGLAATNP